MATWKTCSKCGKIHAYGFKCNVGVDYNRSKLPEDRLRSKYAWTKKSKQIRADAGNLCEVCKDQGIATYDGLEVHHIEKLRDNVDGLLDDDNLICLCTRHHKEADNGEIDKEYLRELVKKRKGLKMICNKCKKIFVSGNKNGLPNGIGFELEDGKVITLCQDCIIKLGALDDKGKDAFFKELGVEKGV